LRVLYILESNDGVNLRTVADALASRASSVSRLCDRLQAIGLIERVPSVSSRREVELRLTTRGQAYLRDLRDRREAELQAILAKMPTARRAALIEGLESFRSAATPRLLGGDNQAADARTA
jgi:DNA-binding MarR family transcriptional regulator